jgi:hypothetical protein
VGGGAAAGCVAGIAGRELERPVVADQPRPDQSPARVALERPDHCRHGPGRQSGVAVEEHGQGRLGSLEPRLPGGDADVLLQLDDLDVWVVRPHPGDCVVGRGVVYKDGLGPQSGVLPNRPEAALDLVPLRVSDNHHADLGHAAGRIHGEI